MATLSLNVKFNPISFDQYIKPVIDYNNAYNTAQTGLDSLVAESQKDSQYITPGTKAYEIQQNYLQKVNDLSDTLATEGMSNNLNMDNVRDLRRVYMQDMLPVKNAAGLVTKNNEVVRQQMIKNPGLIVDYLPNIDDFLVNPNAKAKLIDGKSIQDDCMKIGKTLSSAYSNQTDPQIIHLSNMLLDIKTNKGGTPEQLAQLYENLEKMPVFQQVLAQHGVTDLKDPTTMDKVLGFMKTGLFQGFELGVNHQIKEDPIAVQNYKAAKDLQTYKQKLQYKDAYENAKSNQYLANYRETAVNPDTNAKNLANSHNIVNRDQKYLNWMAEKGYMTADRKITAKGRQAFSNPQTELDRSAHDYIQKLMNETHSTNIDSFSVNLYNQYLNRDKTNAGSIKEYTHDIKDSKEFSNRLVMAIKPKPGKDPFVHEFSGEITATNGSLMIKNGKKINLKEICAEVKKGDAEFTEISYVPKTGQAIVSYQDKKGNIKRLVLDSDNTRSVLGTNTTRYTGYADIASNKNDYAKENEYMNYAWSSFDSNGPEANKIKTDITDPLFE